MLNNLVLFHISLLYWACLDLGFQECGHWAKVLRNSRASRHVIVHVWYS